MAIVGSGPAAMYAADELLTQRGVRVNVFEKLPTPYGLVRAGVAPDHQSTKRVTRLFDVIGKQPGFKFFLNVEVGKHLTHADLLEHHHAVLYAVGAPNDRRLDDRRHGAARHAAPPPRWWPGSTGILSSPTCRWTSATSGSVIVGNGNVAFDVARILTTDPDALARTDISDHALAALRASKVHEVVIAARRGPAESAFTLPELIGSDRRPATWCSTRPTISWWCADLATRDGSVDPQQARDPGQAGRCRRRRPTRPRIRLAYRLTPQRVLGEERVERDRVRRDRVPMRCARSTPVWC